MRLKGTEGTTKRRERGRGRSGRTGRLVFIVGAGGSLSRVTGCQADLPSVIWSVEEDGPAIDGEFDCVPVPCDESNPLVVSSEEFPTYVEMSPLPLAIIVAVPRHPRPHPSHPKPPLHARQ